LEYRIENLIAKKLVGKRMKMSFSVNKTHELWHSFMSCRKEIQNNIGQDLYSMQIYDPLFFNNFKPNIEFEKWAAIEVADFKIVPEGMESFILKGGLYVVFKYKGATSEASGTFQYILGTWLPDSEFKLDNRPHFEILGEKFKNEDPGSEEEIWIPIRPKL
jgi:AraC family transcriptional regulator